MADNITQIWAAQQVLAHPDASPEDINRAAQILKTAQAGATNDNLGNTLQLGVPYTNMRADTGIPIPKAVSAGLAGAGQVTDSLMQTGRQLYNAMTGNSQANTQQGQDQAFNAQAMNQLSDQYPGSVMTGQIAANAIPFLGTNAAIAKGLGMAGVEASRFLPSLLNNIGAGTLTGAAEYAPDAGQHVAQAALGGVGGAAGDLAGKVLGRLAQPMQSKMLPDAYAAALAAKNAIPGINIPTMQQLGSGAGQMMENAVAKLPSGANLSGELGKANEEAIARAANQQMGLTGDQVFLGSRNTLGGAQPGSARQIVGDRLDTALGGGQVMVDSSGVRAINNLTNKMADPATGLSGGQLSAYKDAVQMVVDKLSPTTDHAGIISGDSYVSLRRALTSAMSDAPGDAKSAIYQLRTIVDKQAASSVGPQANNAFKTANQQWSALEQLSKAIDSPATPGNVSPLRLKNATNPTLAAIGRYGQDFKPYPDSGTAPRMLWQEMMMNPALVGGGLAGILGGMTNHPELALAGAGAGWGLQALGRGMLRGTGADTLAKWSMSPTGNAIRKAVPYGGGLLGTSILDQKYNPYSQMTQ